MENRYGFEFEYRARRIAGASKVLCKEDMDKIDPAKSSPSAIYVRCGNCGEYMDFASGPEDALNGKWICRTCRVYVRETKIWRQINREVELCDDILNGLDDDDSENTDE